MEQRPHGCPRRGCEWSFAKHRDLERHLNDTHEQATLWSCAALTSLLAPPATGAVAACRLCGEWPGGPLDAAAHASTRHAVGLCGEEFKRRDRFRDHLRSAHGAVDENFLREAVERCRTEHLAGGDAPG